MLAAKRRAQLLVAAGLATLAACAREQEAFHCPDVGEGDLVVSEIRGQQTDAAGQWFELFNGSGADIDLFGLRLTITPLAGGDPDVLLVRTDPVEVLVDDYVVLGRFDEGAQRPDHVDYGFGVDFEDCTEDGDATTCSTMDIETSARLDVEACGVVTDSAIYRNLPETGTLAFDGTMPPTAEGNDDEDRWCNDTTERPPGDPTLPGTPGEENPPCP